MIAVVGHTDLTAQTLKLLQDELIGRIKRLAPPGAIVVIRAGRGLPLAAGRAARKAGVPVVAVLPPQESVPAPLPQQDQAAAGELLFLAAHGTASGIRPGRHRRVCEGRRASHRFLRQPARGLGRLARR